jgi:hypothetical protein
MVILEFDTDKVEQREGLIVDWIFSEISQLFKTLLGNLFQRFFFLGLSFGDSLDALFG